MAKTNAAAKTAVKARAAAAPRTHGGGAAAPADKDLVNGLRRLVGANLLFENQFYRTGSETADDLLKACYAVDPLHVAALAIEGVDRWKLRHTPLYMAVALATHPVKNTLVRGVLRTVVNRADALSEALAMFAKVNGCGTDKLKGNLPMGFKRGLADAFQHFDAYQLAKYNRSQAVKLRDVIRLTHPKPKDAEQAKLWKQVLEDTLPTPDTWEVALSAGKDKGTEFTRLLNERKLPNLAFLRNLRNMTESGVDRALIIESMEARKFDNILPFQFLAAAREVPALEAALDKAMLKSIEGMEPMKGSTGILIDVSGSMEEKLSKGELTRLDAAAGLAILARGLCSGDVRVATYTTGGGYYRSNVMDFRETGRVGMALRDFIVNTYHSGTPTYEAVGKCAEEWDVDRFLLITDEQATDGDYRSKLPRVGKQGNYVMNVASYKPGLATKDGWETITGFSEAALTFIRFMEEQ